MPLDELAKLIASPFHEHRLIGLLILVDQHTRGDGAKKAELHGFYLEHLPAVNNWDLVDTSAAALVGEHVGDDPKLLKRLATSETAHRDREYVCRLASGEDEAHISSCRMVAG